MIISTAARNTFRHDRIVRGTAKGKFVADVMPSGSSDTILLFTDNSTKRFSSNSRILVERV